MGCTYLVGLYGGQTDQPSTFTCTNINCDAISGQKGKQQAHV